jgi:hypothetical protein
VKGFQYWIPSESKNISLSFERIPVNSFLKRN